MDGKETGKPYEQENSAGSHTPGCGVNDLLPGFVHLLPKLGIRKPAGDCPPRNARQRRRSTDVFAGRQVRDQFAINLSHFVRLLGPRYFFAAAFHVRGTGGAPAGLPSNCGTSQSNPSRLSCKRASASL